MNDFNKANLTIHKSEDLWAWKYLKPLGFTVDPMTKTGIGFVRTFRYNRGPQVIVATSGASCDYWHSEGMRDLVKEYESGSLKKLNIYWADLRDFTKWLLKTQK